MEVPHIAPNCVLGPGLRIKSFKATLFAPSKHLSDHASSAASLRILPACMHIAWGCTNVALTDAVRQSFWRKPIL